MQVFASFSVSIMVDGKLWGLIASHNDAPGLISLADRLACTQLIQAFVERINQRRVIQQRMIARGISDSIGNILASSKSHRDLSHGLLDVGSNLQEQIDFSSMMRG